MSYELTLSFTDPQGRRRSEVVRSARYTIGRAEGNDLTLDFQNLSRLHAVIDSAGGRPRVSDCGSRNGTRVNGRPVGAPVELRDGDTISLGNACELTVSLRPAAHAPGTHAYTAPLDAPLHAAPFVAPSSAAAPDSAPPSHPSSPAPAPGVLSSPLARYAVIVAVPCAIILLTLLLLLAFGRGAENAAGDDPAPPSRERANSDSDPEAGGDPDAPADDSDPARDASPAADDPPARVSPGGSSEEAGGARADVSSEGGGLSPGDGGAAGDASPGGALSDEQVTQAVRRVMSSISTDNTPYLPASGARDVAAKVRAYSAASAQTAARLNAARRSCSDVSAQALRHNLKPSLVMYAALAASEGGADPAAAARQMLPKLLTLRAIFGTDTANSALLMVAAYPYPFDPPIGSQTRVPHPLYVQLIASGGRRSKVDPAVARSVWFLREQNAIRPDAYDLAVSTLALGVISQNPRRYGVNAEPPLC